MDDLPETESVECKDLERFPSKDYPALSRVASEASRANQKLHTLWSRTELGLLLLTAGLISLVRWGVRANTSSSADDDTAADLMSRIRSYWIGNHDTLDVALRTAIVIALIAALVLKLAIRLRRYEARWYESRRVAEGIKSESWKYMMQAPPYGGDDVSAHAELRVQLDRLVGTYPEISGEFHRFSAEQRQVTKKMNAIRDSSFPERRSSFVVQRIQEQICYFTNTTDMSKKQDKRWFAGGVAVQLVAVAVAVVAISYARLPMLQFTVALSIAVTALNRARFFEDQGREYGNTLRDLISLRDMAEMSENQEQFADVVRDVEMILDRENNAWFARHR